MTIIDLLITASASWYIAYALTSTDGPGGVFAWIREHVPHGRRGGDIVETRYDFDQQKPVEIERTLIHNGLLDCIICTMIWVSLIVTLAPVGVITYALAAAGIALWAHGFTSWRLNV